MTRPPRSVDELAARHAGKKPSPVEVKAALVEERAHLVNLHRCCKEHILILRQRRDECSKRLKKIDKILNR